MAKLSKSSLNLSNHAHFMLMRDIIALERYIKAHVVPRKIRLRKGARQGEHKHIVPIYLPVSHNPQKKPETRKRNVC